MCDVISFFFFPWEKGEGIDIYGVFGDGGKTRNGMEERIY